jgi:GTP-binding protein EngB required for normal cell division
VETEGVDELEELLRRCHRRELLPLARALQVNPTGLGLADLAQAVSRTLRRHGGHGLANLVFRGGEGPTYSVLLANLAKRQRSEHGDNDESTEQILLTEWVDQSWRKMSLAERERLWAHLGMPPPVPDDGQQALTRAQYDLGSSFGYCMAAGLSRIAIFAIAPVAPLAGCLTLLLVARPRDSLLLPSVLEVARLRQAVRHRVTVGVVGSPSCGKDAAIGAVFGLKTGNVSPIAGSTKEVSITRMPTATALFLVNTPGLGDVIESVTEEARQVLDLIDVYLYIINAQGGVQARELADFRSCRQTGRPVLAVVNKIDTIREEDRPRFLEDACQKLDISPQDFLAVAFDPLPQLAEQPLGLEPLQKWLTDHLVELGKDPAELPWLGS